MTTTPRPPSERITLLSDDGDVQVWRMGLEGDAGKLVELLSADERERALAFHFEHDRRRFAVARGSMRQVLAAYVNADPASIAFEYGRFGKPALAGGAGPHFNLSHADDLALLAVRRGGEVGVDVERVARPFDHLKVAADVLSPEQARAVANAPPADRAATFFRFWTAREAVLKAVGVGVSGMCDGATFAEFERRCVVRTFDPAPGYVATLAIL